MVAMDSGLTHFEKVEGWDITPPAEPRQKQDFSDPQAYYNAETDTITVTASQDGTARILQYPLSGKAIRLYAETNSVFFTKYI